MTQRASKIPVTQPKYLSSCDCAPRAHLLTVLCGPHWLPLVHVNRRLSFHLILFPVSFSPAFSFFLLFIPLIYWNLFQYDHKENQYSAKKRKKKRGKTCLPVSSFRALGDPNHIVNYTVTKREMERIYSVCFNEKGI